jgi:hypothetical protein
MAATVRGAVRELLEQTMVTMDALLAASDDELAMPSSHACAQGKDLWTLITNDIDHEKIHTGQVLEGRYESRITASPLQRLLAEWLQERARFIGSLVGLTDEQFNAETPGRVDIPRGGEARAQARAGFVEGHRRGPCRTSDIAIGEPPM